VPNEVRLAKTQGLTSPPRLGRRCASTQQRAVVIEFGRLEQARVAPDSSAYAEALAALAGGAKRDIRFVEGV
jgi:uncharacterized protein (DUF1330 family)